MTNTESALDALMTAIRGTPMIVDPTPVDQEAYTQSLIDRLEAHTGTYELTDEEADDLAGCIRFMRGEGYW